MEIRLTVGKDGTYAVKKAEVLQFEDIKRRKEGATTAKKKPKNKS
ncbi:hypothetical protein [Priestia megaterium]